MKTGRKEKLVWRSNDDICIANEANVELDVPNLEGEDSFNEQNSKNFEEFERYKINCPDEQSSNTIRERLAKIQYEESDQLFIYDSSDIEQEKPNDSSEKNSVLDSNDDMKGGNETARFEAESPKNNLKRQRVGRKRYDDVKKDMAATNRRIDDLTKSVKMLVSFIKKNKKGKIF